MQTAVAFICYSQLVGTISAVFTVVSVPRPNSTQHGSHLVSDAIRAGVGFGLGPRLYSQMNWLGKYSWYVYQLLCSYQHITIVYRHIIPSSTVTSSHHLPSHHPIIYCHIIPSSTVTSSHRLPSHHPIIYRHIIPSSAITSSHRLPSHHPIIYRHIILSSAITLPLLYALSHL